MSIFSRLKFWEKRNIGREDQWVDAGSLVGINSGVVTQWKAVQVSAVFACVRLISNSIAMMPLNLHQLVGDTSRIANEKPLNNVLSKGPNVDTSAFIFKQTMQTHLLLWGNAYAEKIYNNKHEIIELHILYPWLMDVSLVKGKRVYEYRDGVKTIKFEASQIFHLPGLSFDGLKGYAPITTMRNELNLTIALQQFGCTYFENGANLGLIIEHPDMLTDKGRRNIKKSIKEEYQGVDNAHKFLLLEEGMRVNRTSIPAEDAQFIQSRKFQLEEICRYFGVQLHMIQNLDKASFNNIEQQSLEFKTYCLGPWISAWESEINRSLLNELEQGMGYYAKFNMNSLMRADYKTRMEGYRTGVQMGLYSLNEVRKMEDMNPLDSDSGGDIHWVNSAMVNVQEVLNRGRQDSEPLPALEQQVEKEGDDIG